MKIFIINKIFFHLAFTDFYLPFNIVSSFSRRVIFDKLIVKLT